MKIDEIGRKFAEETLGVMANIYCRLVPKVCT